MGEETSNQQSNLLGFQHSVEPAGSNTFPDHQFYEMLLKQFQRRQPVAVATVIAVRGSASAKAGSKAIISHDGRNVFGWVGGGCAESFVIQHALESIGADEPRVINVDLNDEVFGVGMPCGGNIDVYIEPVMPSKRLLIVGSDRTSHLLREWAHKLGFDVLPASCEAAEADAEYFVLCPNTSGKVTFPPDRGVIVKSGLPIEARTPAEVAISLLAKLLTLETSSSGQPLWNQLPEQYQPLAAPQRVRRSHLVLVGHNRITESLAKLAISLDWTVAVNSVQASQGAYPSSVCRVVDDDGYALNEVGPGSYVVIATQHKGDYLVLRSILTRQPSYIGLIASRSRAALVMDKLKSEGILELARTCLRAPCGWALGARSPFEIALAICCELIADHNSNPA